MSCTPCAVGGGGIALAATAALFAINGGPPVWTALAWTAAAAVVGIVSLVAWILIDEHRKRNAWRRMP